MTVAISAEEIKAGLRCGNAGCACRKGPNVHCPSHDDARASLTVNESGDKVLVNCKTGCSQADVIDALKGRHLWPEIGKERSNGKTELPKDEPVAVYEYRNEAGDLVAVKARFEYGTGAKSFKWKMPNKPTWSGLEGLPMSDIPLWGADLLNALPMANLVYFVEGEKAAQACRNQGLTALTHGGGASTNNFGDSLSVLKGRQVVLWPDNDEAGRRYMARVHAALRPVAKSVILVTPPLPEKGDAVEFFAAGGSVVGLLKDAPPSQAVVEYLAHDAIRVRVPTGIGIASFTFTSMEKGSRDLTSELEFHIEKNGGEPYAQRLNLLSGSQTTELRRNLDEIYGKENGWTQILVTAIGKARSAFLQQDRAVRLSTIPDPGPPEFLVSEILQSGVANVWFGSGSSLKTFLALRAAISVAMGLPYNGREVISGAVLFVDYENTQETFRFRCGRLLAGLGHNELPDANLYYWPARGIPLADQIDAVRAKVEADGILLVIVDSAAAACGGKPEDADIALAYFRALSKLGPGVTTLTICHVPKAGDTECPFGSIFWTNQPRRTWYVERTSDEETDTIDVGMFCKKVNDGRKPCPIAYNVTFAAQAGPVKVEQKAIGSIQQLSVKRLMKNQIWDVLDKPMPITEIVKALELKPTKAEYIGKVLAAEKWMFAAAQQGAAGRGNSTVWARVTHPEEKGINGDESKGDIPF